MTLLVPNQQNGPRAIGIHITVACGFPWAVRSELCNRNQTGDLTPSERWPHCIPWSQAERSTPPISGGQALRTCRFKTPVIPLCSWTRSTLRPNRHQLVQLEPRLCLPERNGLRRSQGLAGASSRNLHQSRNLTVTSRNIRNRLSARNRPPRQPEWEPEPEGVRATSGCLTMMMMMMMMMMTMLPILMPRHNVCLGQGPLLRTHRLRQ